MSSSARREISGSERAISALTGYCMGSLVVVPFDRVKTLMQATPGACQRGLSVARDIVARDGLRGIYRGLDVQMLIAPYTVFYYCVYDELLKSQGDHRLAPLSAAVGARTLEVTLRMPLELLRTQLQAEGGHATLSSLIRDQRHRPWSVWMQGYSATLLRDVPFSAIYWFSYEETKRQVSVPEGVISSPGLRTLVHSFTCGGAAGMFAALVTTPVDVIKTLRQKLSSAGEGLSSSSRPASTSYTDILVFLFANPRSAFCGIGPRLLRVPLGLGTMMSGIETAKWFFAWRRERS